MLIVHNIHSIFEHSTAIQKENYKIDTFSREDENEMSCNVKSLKKAAAAARAVQH